jgi:shikimate dehydrogenase
MLHFGILAHPVSHSLSPLMYETGFKACRINADFLKFDVVPSALPDFLQRVREGVIDLAGCAVSLPHKQTCMAFLDSIDPVAANIGAVNTIVRRGKKLIGYNTDWCGIEATLSRALEISRRHSTLKWKRVLLFGSGGMAAACAYVLHKKGAHIFIHNRTWKKAHDLADRFDAEVIDDPVHGSEIYDFVIQATSVGLIGDRSVVPISFWEDHGNGVAIDVVYGRAETRFLREASRAGWDIVGGEFALAAQGAAQFELLTGKNVAPDIFLRTILK